MKNLPREKKFNGQVYKKMLHVYFSMADIVEDYVQTIKAYNLTEKQRMPKYCNTYYKYRIIKDKDNSIAVYVR